MRPDRVRSLALLIGVASLLALLPVFPVWTTEFQGWFGPPGGNTRWVNGTTFHPMTEVLGGGLDWTTTTGGCITDAGSVSRFQASPLLVVAWALAVLGLWFGLSRALPARRLDPDGVAAAFGAIGIALASLASVWLVWSGLLWISCPADLAVAQATAAALEFACLGIGVGLIVARRALGRRPPDSPGAR